MKEPNVLEAKNLCVNGNPIMHERDSAEQIFFRLWHYDDAMFCQDYSTGWSFSQDKLHLDKDTHSNIWDNFFKTMSKKGHQEYIQGMNKAKAAESDQIKRAQKLGHALKYATIQSDQLGKSLIRMRRRKKRHSISTPITRAIK